MMCVNETAASLFKY